MYFADLDFDDLRWGAAYAVLQQLRGSLGFDAVMRVYEAGRPQGLVFTVAFDAQDRCLGVAGWRVMDTLTSVRKLFIEDLVVDDGHRSEGVGEAILHHLEERAKALGCRHVDLDSGHHRADAHRFYERLGYEDISRHFRKSLS